MKNKELAKFMEVQRRFIKERDWEQFHQPKNLAIALNVEASELLENFLWDKIRSSEEIRKDPKFKQIKKEVIDVFYYVLRISDVLEIDLEKEFTKKMKENRKKYPVKKAKGNSKKYNEL